MKLQKKLLRQKKKNIGNYRIFYPTELKTSEKQYSIVVVVNASNTAALNYEVCFKRLASWGFIVIGNDDRQAGTGKTDDNGKSINNEKELAGICPLEALKYIYNTMNSDITRVRARFKGTEHQEILHSTDVYMTAWMLWHLQGNEKAKSVFFGDSADITTNANWQDIEKSI